MDFGEGYERNVLMMKKAAMLRTPARNNQSPGALQYLNKPARTATGPMLRREATEGRQAQAIALPKNNHAHTTYQPERTASLSVWRSFFAAEDVSAEWGDAGPLDFILEHELPHRDLRDLESRILQT
jgi:hypothetical protein